MTPPADLPAPLTLFEKQALFTMLVADLIQHAHGQGWQLTFGEAYRTPEQAALNAQKGIGIARSLHTDRLAIDFNLFKGGVYQTVTEAYRPLGEYWEAQSQLPAYQCCWGGRFTRADGNHFSLAYEGRQ